MEMFDSVSAAESGAWLHLTDQRTGTPAFIDGDEKKPCRIRLLGMDSAAVRGRVKRRAAGLAKRRVKQGNIAQMSEDQILDLMGDAERNSILDAVDATEGWENLSRDGKPLEYSKENAEWLFSTYPAIFEEVGLFLSDRAIFFGKA